MTIIALVVAMSENGMIGDCGTIPWRIADDMNHFKRVTMGKPCIMGRKTWDSLPRKPLPGRTNIVLTRDDTFAAAGAFIVHSLEEALALAIEEKSDEIAVIGGGEIYAMALSHAKRIHLTEVHRESVGDTRFVFDRVLWRETAREDRLTEEGLRYSFITLERR